LVLAGKRVQQQGRQCCRDFSILLLPTQRRTSTRTTQAAPAAVLNNLASAAFTLPWKHLTPAICVTAAAAAAAVPNNL
jgi:hypothetical protein